MPLRRASTMYNKIIEDEIQRIKRDNLRLTRDDVSDLISKAKKGDSAATEVLWRSHLLFLTKYLGRSQYTDLIDPDEALSISWESIVKAIDSYRGGSSFSQWYLVKFRIDLNSEWRRRCRQAEREVPLEGTSGYLDVDDMEEIRMTNAWDSGNAEPFSAKENRI